MAISQQQLTEASVSLDNARTISIVSAGIRSGFKQLVIDNRGKIPVIMVVPAGNSAVIKLSGTPELMTAICGAVADRLDTLVQALASQAQTTLATTPPSSTVG